MNDVNNVLHLNTFTYGGAFNASYRLHTGLKAAGYNSKYLAIQMGDNPVPDDVQLFKNDNSTELSRLEKVLYKFRMMQHPYDAQKQKSRLKKRALENRSSATVFSHPDTISDVFQHGDLKTADVIMLHNVSWFLDYESFFMQVSVPVIWRLADENPYTGGCHYSLGCDKYERDCDVCPQLEGANVPAFSNRNWKIKKKSFDKTKATISIVSPSQWISDKAQNSSLLGNFRHEVIPNGIETELFKNFDHKKSRAALQFEEGTSYLLFVCGTTSSPYKGFNDAYQAFLKLDQKNKAKLVIIGQNDTGIEHDDIIFAGSISDKNKMYTYFSAADAYIMSSHHDNYPSTVLESLCSGTPVIGYSIGGVPEMVDQTSGVLTSDFSVDELTSKLQQFLNYEIQFDRKKIKMESMQKFDIRNTIKKYSELISEVYNSNSK